MSARPILRDTFRLGSSTPTQQLSNQLGFPWLTIWNTSSGSIAVGAPYQIVGAMRRRSFYVQEDDPITLFQAWGQVNSFLVAQPKQSDRTISYALSEAPLSGLEEEPIYSTPALLAWGTVFGNQQSRITPNAAEVYTHLDTAWANAQADGLEQEEVELNYSGGLDVVGTFPPAGSSRTVLEVYGPTFIVVECGSLSARCDWQAFGVANVVR